jgi:hypothetical protein
MLLCRAGADVPDAAIFIYSSFRPHTLVAGAHVSGADVPDAAIFVYRAGADVSDAAIYTDS